MKGNVDTRATRCCVYQLFRGEGRSGRIELLGGSAVASYFGALLTTAGQFVHDKGMTQYYYGD